MTADDLLARLRELNLDRVDTALRSEVAILLDSFGAMVGEQQAATAVTLVSAGLYREAVAAMGLALHAVAMRH